MLRQGFKPPPSGVIVVRPRVGNGVRAAIVREMRVTGIAVEAELEHPDSRHLELIAKRHNVGSDNAEVFGNERQVAQLSPDGLEESSAGAGDPMSVFGGLRRR